VWELFINLKLLCTFSSFIRLESATLECCACAAPLEVLEAESLQSERLFNFTSDLLQLRMASSHDSIAKFSIADSNLNLRNLSINPKIIHYQLNIACNRAALSKRAYPNRRS